MLKAVWGECLISRIIHAERTSGRSAMPGCLYESKVKWTNERSWRRRQVDCGRAGWTVDLHFSPFAEKERKLGRVRVDDGWWIRWLVETGWYRRMLMTVDVWWLRLMAETGWFQRMTTIADECWLRRLVETRIYWRFSTETGESVEQAEKSERLTKSNHSRCREDVSLVVPEIHADAGVFF